MSLRRRRTRDRSVKFDVIDNVLTRRVAFPDGHHYTHRCSREVYRQVAHAIETQASEGVTLDSLAAALDAPSTQVNVALEFMKERGCIVIRPGTGRRSFPASRALYEDALCEFCFLAELPY